MTHCKGCGAELPPQKRGRERLWCTDRCRKQRSYVRLCVDCGKQLNASNGHGPRASVRCNTCNGAHSRELTRAWIIESMQEWARIFGVQPAAADWNQPYCRHMVRKTGGPFYQKLIDRFESTGRPWPPQATVQAAFGSWNEALVAAGFEPLKPNEHWIGVRGRKLRDEEMAA